MYGRERRRVCGDSTATLQLKAGLTPRQLATMATMEHFGWTLKFVRRPMFMPPVPVVFGRARQQWAVIEEDGAINEKPGFRIRD